MEYYEALGIDKNADQDEIKKAYRKAAMECHPDRNPDDKEAEEKFKLVNEAYSVLSDPEKKLIYDQHGKDGLSARGHARPNQNPHDIFNDLFGGAFGDFFRSHPRGQQRSSRGSDLHADLEVSLANLVFGDKRSITIPVRHVCSLCAGTGSKGPLSQCSDCRGAGQVSFMRGFMNLTTTCPKCRGAGNIIKDVCTACRGSGFENKSEKLEIDIPAGIRPGQTLQFQGSGNRDTGPTPGDLLVTLKLNNYTNFTIQGHNLFSDINVNCVNACLGYETNVHTLDGEKKIRIPAGVQQSQKIKLSNLGFPKKLGNVNNRGDLLLCVNITIPKKLNAKQKKLLQSVKEIGI